MKKIRTESAYQKMLLVTPMVYQKLLNCIDEKDKISTEELNAPKFDGNVKSVSEKLLEQISSKDMGIQVTPQISSKETGIQVTPATTEFGTQMIPETNIPQMVTVSTETDTSEIIPPYQGMPMSTQTEPEITSHEVSTNPLRTSCPQDTDQGSIIPTLFYRPSYKTKRVNKINKPELEFTPTPHLEYNPDPLMHTRPLQEQDIRFAKQLPSFSPRSLGNKKTDFKILGGISKSNFHCSICGNTFTRKHDLKRHLASPTVHKNFKPPPIPPPVQSVEPSVEPDQPIPPMYSMPPPVIPEPPPESFRFWGDKTSLPKPKIRVSVPPNAPEIMDISRQTVLGKRTHGKAKLGNLRYPTKLRRENIPGEEFEKW